MGAVSRGRRRAGQEGWQGKEKVVEEGCRQVGERNSIPREPKQINTRNRRKKQNKMDKQEKNRKPVNQGKSYK